MEWIEKIKELCKLFSKANWYRRIAIILIFICLLIVFYHKYNVYWDDMFSKNELLSNFGSSLRIIVFLIILFAIIIVFIPINSDKEKGEENEIGSLPKSGKFSLKKIFIIIILAIIILVIKKYYDKKVEHEYVNLTNIPTDTVNTISQSSNVLKNDSIQNGQKDTIITKPGSLTSNSPKIKVKGEIKNRSKKRETIEEETEKAFNYLVPLR